MKGEAGRDSTAVGTKGEKGLSYLLSVLSVAAVYDDKTKHCYE